ncbi:type II toxin-antitoxin system RatA family toxin [Lentzea sp. HUAS TT2]|uniref:type II toxin-antitoxin system RatA family toxin n=1 Tax=Lentzea sp. HUAS TT2 TaxID=3447454 RepID=UPI003F73087B
MRNVSLYTFVPDADATKVFERISDFPRYADYTDAVREVRIDHREGDHLTSTWSVNFRDGVLCWTERDRIDAELLDIEFEQLSGDFAVFTGSWRVEQIEGNVAVLFTAAFDLGMPTLAAIIDPIAERALLDNIQSILVGLLGTTVIFSTDGEPELAGARQAS